MQKPLPRIQPQLVSNFPVYDLSGGLNDSTNQVTLANNEIFGGYNMILNDVGKWVSRGMHVKAGQLLGIGTSAALTTDDLLGIYYAPQLQKLLCATKSDLWTFQTNTWTAQAQSLTSTNPSSFWEVNGKIYYVNKTDGTRNYNGSAWTAMPNFPVTSAASTDQPSGITSFKERLIAWNTVTNPKRIYYSDAGAETCGASNYFDVAESVQFCMPMFDDFLLIFTTNHIYRINSFIFTGTAYDPDRIDEISYGIGSNSPASIVKIGGLVYFTASDGNIMTTDGVQVIDISGKIKNTIATTATFSWACGFKKYYICSSGSGRNMMVYNTERKIWSTLQTFSSVSDNTTPLGIGISYMTNAAGIIYAAGYNTGGQTFKIFTGGGESTFAPTDVTDCTSDEEVVLADYLLNKDSDTAITASTTVRAAQSFSVTAVSTGDCTLDAVDIFLKKNSGTTTNLTVRIETNNAGVPSGTLVDASATGTITAFSTATYSYKRVTFNSTFSLSANVTYWIVLKHTTEGSGDSSYHWGADATSPTYTSGNAATYGSGTWTAVAGTDQLFRVWIIRGPIYSLITKTYFLGDPQRYKKIKKAYIDVDVRSQASTGYSSTLSSPYEGNSKGFTLTNPAQLGYSSSEDRKMYSASNLKGRDFYIQIKLQNDPGLGLIVNGFELNYVTINSIK